MTALTLTEYQCREAVSLSDSTRDTLRRLVPSMTVAPTVGTAHQYDLTPGHCVGSVQTDDLVLIIRPKLPISRFLFMVSYAIDPQAWTQTPFVYEEQRSVVEAVIPGFLSHLRRAVGRGVLQGYRTEEDTLQTVRGRVRFADQIRRHYGRCVPAEVTFDDFTADIDENRILKAALRRLRGLRIRSPENRQGLRRYNAALSFVADVEYPAQGGPSITYTRLNEHYRPAVELAQLILRSTSFEFLHGHVSGTAALFDMNKVFENFVVAALRDALQVSERAFVQGAKGKTLRLDQANRVTLKPDISWWHEGVCRFIGDIKYKAVTVTGIKHVDLYQLLAYTTATQLRDGVLIYARGEAEPVTHVIPFAEKQLHVTALDLAGEPHEILAEIGDVAGLIQRLYRRSQVPRVA